MFAIKRLITIYYKQGLKEDTIKSLQAELDEEKAKTEKANKEIEKLSAINHKYTTRIDIAEDCIKNLTNNMSAEFSEELSNVKEMIENLSKEYKTELSENITVNPNIQRANVAEIDSVINYFEKQTSKDKIEFKFKIECDIKDFLENTIDKSKLVTMLVDHIKDAIIAINSKESNNKSISVILRESENTYEICISDTGIPFEIDTLLNLGLERVTTHKKTGGTGIGFMTTFENLRSCKASLIIKEYDENEEHYTKSIIIRFDGKNEYKICSYRAEEIANKTKGDRIKIEKILKI